MLRELTGVQRAVLLGLAVLLLGAVALIAYRRGQPTPSTVEQAYSSQAPPGPAQMMVYVAGEVVRPGLYYLPRQARVYQALQAAGGFTPQADQQALNLAQVLKDGQQVLVRVKPVPPPTLPPAPGVRHSAEVPPAPAAKETSADVQFPLSLNTATAEQLLALPGVGEATAQRILQYRQQYGGFKRAEELMLIEGIGPAKFEQLQPYVVP